MYDASMCTTVYNDNKSVINASNLFTKEPKYEAHYCHYHDSMNVSKANFNTRGHITPLYLQNKKLSILLDLHPNPT
ncbi:hypothetical protein ACHAWX_006324 [Stephanocyclus meneghinianus]